MRRSADEMRRGLIHRLNTDTNTLLSISTGDRKMKMLADSINTELRLLREERRKLQGGNQDLYDAITNLSHDVRTPLTAICGYLDLLGNEEKSDDAARYLALIGDRIQALKQLTDELFDYSLAHSLHEPLLLEPLSLNAILEESLAAFYAAFTTHGITPQVHMTDTPVLRPLHKGALLRVFGNVLTNVLKYSDGDLIVTLDQFGQVLFTNTAHTLTQIQVGKLFERYFSVEEAKGSTGIGLSIARELIEKMHGTISAELKDAKLTICISFI
jgi:signal transduction histidine kinase